MNTWIASPEDSMAPHLPGGTRLTRTTQAGDDVTGVLLSLADVVKTYDTARGRRGRRNDPVEAVSHVDLTVKRGSTVGLVGESGSGKSTIARLVLGLTGATSGSIELDGHDVTHASTAERRSLRRVAQMVFQDPYSSFDPHASIGQSLAEPLREHFRMKGTTLRARQCELLDHVGLAHYFLDRYPSEMSGGQLQRAAIARALAVNPQLLVLDEPVSALDVSTQAQVINLLQDLQASLQIALLFIAHDLSVVRHISDRVAVMYAGRIVEEGDADTVYRKPAHPYTQALLSAIPVPDPVLQRQRRKLLIDGDGQSGDIPRTGCRFRPRCPFAMPTCEQDPPAYTGANGSVSRCWLHTAGPALAGRSVATLLASPEFQPQASNERS